ncbi:glyceraldehyde-3-phosphate dehydrogenase [Amnibacterium kyonggiense]|uniref:Glyceraldehyde 3-phosphate dehydrogenase n=1 Tax=Amnibacterium kyonggiense TaxID=595671 RepID=A0A4R7FJB0_9MICO|nr:glyceraldehyde-3-phosphate dehydrogenase [Amnibacterium kyonggiense]TDS76076.1 glyceraldehyde 3-phosphate dehydrogenase [Amnibacterium kyonggiense]
MERTTGWAERIGVAEAMIPVIGALHRRNGVALTMHGRSLADRSAVEILKLHRGARRIDGVEPDPALTRRVLDAVAALDPGPAEVDLAKLAALARAEGGDVEAAVGRALEAVAGRGRVGSGTPRDVVLLWFGRIGRIVARLLVEQADGPAALRLRAVVVRGGGPADLEKRASLLRRDSVHGRFRGTIVVDHASSTIVANGTPLRFVADTAALADALPDLTDALLIDSTGARRDAASLAAHLRVPGIGRVLLTAPGTGVRNVVMGVNHDAVEDADRIVAAASCTTNAIAPVLQAVDDAWGVESGHVETVHAYTNDQNLTDNFHRGDRRGRAAALNMVLTETGAATAVAKALPRLEGRLTGNAIRVPTADVSLAVLHLRLTLPVTREEVNEHLAALSLDSPLQQQLDYVESHEVASSDFIGSTHAGVVDGLATVCANGSLTLYVWYDNEWGYSSQVVRLAKHLAHGALPSFPVTVWTAAGRRPALVAASAG